MALGRRQLFIYYRLPVADSPAALAAVRTAHLALMKERPVLRARLLTREADADDAAGAPQPLTVMEVYETCAAVHPDGVDAELQALVEQRVCAVLAPWIPSAARHLEVFDEPPCA